MPGAQRPADDALASVPGLGSAPGSAPGVPPGVPPAPAPAPADGVVPIPHGSLAYDRLGTGPTLVLVPGATHRGLFTPVLPLLAQHFDVVRYDRRGHGATRMEAGAPEPASGIDEVADLEALRVHLGLDSFLLLGLSAGGPVAIEYAWHHPSRVRGLVLLSTYADDHARTELAWELLPPIFEARRDAAAAATKGIEDPVERAIADSLVQPHSHYATPLPEPVLRHWITTGCLDPEFPPGQTQFRSSLPQGYDGMARLADLRCPTLVITGRHDAVTPLDHAIAMHEVLSRGDLVVLQHSGHLAFAEEPEAFVGALLGFTVP